MNINSNESLHYLELSINSDMKSENVCFLNLNRKLICSAISTPSLLHQNVISISMSSNLSCGMNNTGYVTCWQNLNKNIKYNSQQLSSLEVPFFDIMQNYTQSSIG